MKLWQNVRKMAAKGLRDTKRWPCRKALCVFCVLLRQNVWLFLFAAFFLSAAARADIVVLNEDQSGDYEFFGTNTYYLTNVVNIYGTATFDAGTVIKYGPDALLSVYAVDCETASNNPAIFTARDDDTVGEILPDSQHVPPLGGYGHDYWSWPPLNTALALNGDENGNTSLQHIEIFYTATGIFDNSGGGTTLTVNDANIRDCGTAIYWQGSDGGSCDVQVSNSRFSHTIFDGDIYSASFTNCIFNDVIIDDGGLGVYSGVTVNIANSLLANTGNIWYDVDVEGTSNQFFNSDLFGDNYQIINLNAPTAYDQTVSTLPNNSVDITLTGYSPDSKPLTYIVIGSPLYGTLSGTPPNLTYTPNTDYIGPDSFTFTVDDGILDSTNATVSIAVDEQVQFTVSVTNDIVNTNLVPMQLNITNDVPDYISIVDSTNFIPVGTTWYPYTSSNIIVDLPSIEGKHEIWIGLQSWSGLVNWQEVTLTLDTNPPVIAITDPTNTTVSVPLVTVQGLVNEELSSLTYDVSNALQVLTNQTGYASDLFYDTNLLMFTTNSFQLYDVPLTNGDNAITIHATDLAGNVTTTNFDVVLDYSSDTNPPVLNLIWPQDGTAIAGTNFTVQATIDDNTATVFATINGQTNAGVVYRSGNVLINDISLSSGTSTLSITAVDAAGNSSVTNISVVQSSVTLTIDPISSDQLNQTGVNLTGTVSSTNEDVYVNGIMATNNGDGTWSAGSVPVNDTGLAGISAQAYPSGSDPSSTSPDGGQNAVQSQPAQIVETSYEEGESDWENTQTDDCWLHDLTDYWAWWIIGQGGKSEHSSEFPATGHCSDGYSDGSSFGTAGAGPWETDSYSDSGAYESGDLWSSSGYTRAKVQLDTGGNGQVGASQLYLVMAQVIDEDTEEQLPGSEVKIQGQTLTDVTNNGEVWSELAVTVPAGVTNYGITPVAVGHNIDFGNGLGDMQSQEVTLKIYAITNGVAIDLSSNVPEFCVGQQVTFSNAFDPPLPTNTIVSYQWAYQGDFINEIIPGTIGTSPERIIDASLLQNQTNSLWWYNGGSDIVAECICTITSGNQTATVTAKGFVNVYRPVITNFVDEPPSYPTNYSDHGTLYLQLGDGNSNGDMAYEVEVFSHYSGKIGLVQLINRDAYNGSLNSGSLGTSGQYWLDTTNPYNGFLQTIPINTETPYYFVDNPGVADVASGLTLTTSCSDQFRDYIVFRPDIGTTANNIFVTLGIISGNTNSWAWSASTIWIGGWSTPTGSVTRPTWPDNDNSFPTWVNTY